MNTPVWVGPLLAVAVFLVVRFVLAPILGQLGEPFGTMFGPFCHTFAPFFGFAVVVIWIFAEIKKRASRGLLDSRSDIGSLRSLSWQEFEQLVGEAYRRQGYSVEETGGGGADGGVDLVLYRNGAKTLVQCKQWKAWKVGVKVVRELYGAVTAEKAAAGIVVTCGEFTREARDFAVGKPLQLVDGPALWNLVAAVKADVPTAAPPVAVPKRPEPSPPRTPSAMPDPKACPLCGSPMVLRTARKGANAGSQFYGCSKYPQCRGTRPVA